MGRTVVITQPTYLPWLGYFEQMAQADVWVVLDNVQFAPRSWQCRNRLKDGRDLPFWLSVPIQAHTRSTPISEITISPDDTDWAERHLASIRHSLARARYFDEYYPMIEVWLRTAHTRLVDLNVHGIRLLADSLQLTPEFVRASDLGVEGNSTNLLVDICRRLDADRYYSAAGSSAYLDAECFAQAGIALEYQHWTHPGYPQLGRTFVPYLSVLDALMNIGAASTRWLIDGTAANLLEVEMV